MAKFGQFFGEKTISVKPVETDFDSKIKGELARAFEDVGDYKKLEEALLREWQDHPHWKDHDYLCHEPLNLEKLKMALALWKMLPTDPTERLLFLDEIKKRGAKDANDQVYLAVQCFEKYHLKNLLLLKRHWYNCFPNTEEPYSPLLFWASGPLGGREDQRSLIYHFDDVLLYVDVPDGGQMADSYKDGRRRFAQFRDKAVEVGLLTEREREFAQRFFEPYWKGK